MVFTEVLIFVYWGGLTQRFDQLNSNCLHAHRRFLIAHNSQQLQWQMNQCPSRVEDEVSTLAWQIPVIQIAMHRRY